MGAEPIVDGERPSGMRCRIGSIAASVVVLVVAAGCGDAKDAEPAEEAAKCDKGGLGTALDIPGPGKPLPEEAVEPYLDAFVLVSVQEDGENATVIAEAPGSDAVRLYDLTRREDGWWPDGYTEC